MMLQIGQLKQIYFFFLRLLLDAATCGTYGWAEGVRVNGARDEWNREEGKTMQGYQQTNKKEREKMSGEEMEGKNTD
jgi:hypothetical protein